MRLSIIVLTASVAYGAVVKVQVRGVTATQAILAYTAPDTNACTVEVSESPSYVPLAHDVDPALFAGSNLDNRAEATGSGLQRVFVAGKRRAEKGSNGRWYSRALQAFTSHYFRITCGGSQGTGTFMTANMALGNTYNDALPADPAVSTRPYFSSVGSYAWPEFLDWNNQDPGARPETVIDPQTGMLLKRLALPQDQPITWLPDRSFQSALDPDSAWTTPNAALTDDGASASFTGTHSNVLFLRDNQFWIAGGTNLWDLTLPTEYLVVSVKSWCSGSCAGEDAKIQACLTINGVTCWPTNATAKYQEVALGTSVPTTFATLGTAVPILDAWTPAGFSPLTKADLSSRSGMVNVDASGVVRWQSGGNPNTYFSPNWTNGSRISIAGSECKIVAMGGSTQLTIDPATCSVPLSLPLTGVAFTGSNFGFLLRKKTASTDTINVQYAKYAAGTSQYIDFTSSGSAKMCSDYLTKNTVTGGLGYHCVTTGNAPLLYWVDHVTGDANYLGVWGDGTLVGTGVPTDPEHYYSAQASGSDTKVVSCTLTSTNQPGNLTTSCTDINPPGKGLAYLMAAFTAADTPAFDSSLYGCNSGVGQQGKRIIFGCSRSQQNAIGWTGVFDPNKIDTAPGCVGGGLPGCVIAAQSTWGNAPARWCGMHTRFLSGDTPVVWVAGEYMSNLGILDDGPYTALVASAATQLPYTPSIAAGKGACPAGSQGCDVVTVDGEPCDTTPQAGENTGSRVCPKNNAWAYLQPAVVGDVFSIEGEFVKLLAKAGNSWTVQRGYGYTPGSATSPSAPRSHSNGAWLNAECMSRDFTNGGISNWSWTWDSAADPHGTNSSGTTVKVAWDYDHPTPRPDVTLGGAPSYAPCGNCYAVRDGVGSMGDAPNRYVTYAPTFSGDGGTASFIERAQDHPSRLQENAPRSEKQWLLDGRPLQPLMDISDAAISVSGQLYRLTSTTTDGDRLSRVGYNIYVVKTSPTTLVAAGNCSTANPCPIWNDTTLQDSITKPCMITLLSGSGTVYISRISSGGLGVTYTSGLAISADTCPVFAGTGYPSGSTPMWVWAATSGTWAASGSDNRGGSSGYFGIITRKTQPTWAYCGMQPLIDASGAVTGDVLSDTAADSYKYCVARKPGECRAAAQPGDIYVNCPNEVKRNDGSYGCMWYSQNQDIPVDICVGNMSAYLNSIVQVGFKSNDYTGALGRTLTRGLTRYKVIDPYWHGKALSDASWMLFRSMYTNGAWTDVLLGKLPPYPPTDSVVRSTFQAIPVKLTPPAGLAVDNAVIQFGYAENGSPGQFYCTSRQEKCLATAATVPATPFLYASEGAGGVETGVSGVPCANGCSVAIPAISQRLLYYQVKYRDGSNNTVATSEIEVVSVP